MEASEVRGQRSEEELVLSVFSESKTTKRQSQREEGTTSGGHVFGRNQNRHRLN